MDNEWLPGVTMKQAEEAMQRSCEDQEKLLREAAIRTCEEDS